MYVTEGCSGAEREAGGWDSFVVFPILLIVISPLATHPFENGEKQRVKRPAGLVIVQCLGSLPSLRAFIA